MSLDTKIGEPKELTDAEAESFIRYLTRTKKRKITLAEVLLETDWGKKIFTEYLKKVRKKNL